MLATQHVAPTILCILPPLAAGYSWCNMPQIVFQQGERVRLHIMALGTESELLSFHFHLRQNPISRRLAMRC